MKFFKLSGIVMLIAAFALTAFAKDVKDEKVAAVVEGKKIYMSEVNNVLESVMARQGMHSSQIDLNSPKMQQVKKSIVENLVNRELLMLASLKNKPEDLEKKVEEEYNRVKSRFKNDKDFENALEKNQMDSAQLKEQLRKNVLLDSYVKNIESGIKISDKEAKKYYENNKDKFKQPEKAKVSHIILRTGEKAKYEKPEKKINEIYKEIKNGKSFEEMAKKYSEDGSAKKGGNLGYIQKGRTVPSFEKVAFDTKVGNISEPFKTKFGYHILKVTDKQEAGQKTFDEMKSSIKEVLKNQKMKEKLNAKLKELRSKYDVKINL
ncbi:peptidylprolyl isomerase [Flexistipes sp.]|uniref:peptidylprolyl isomerase n=1 Tax=Flexistipes sp. TaxID=3088135 RepID=UPI002E22E351|nr:peptidylprolyl isomerase [Flexistipes sp.]